MGANSRTNSAAAIAATFVTQDILNTGMTTANPLDRVAIASVMQPWLMDRLTTNIVAVNGLEKSEWPLWISAISRVSV